MNPLLIFKPLARLPAGMTKVQRLLLLLGGTAIFLGVSLVLCRSDSPTVSTATSETEKPVANADLSHPLDICVVSGRKLGSMGPVFATNNDGIIVRLCCHKCLPEFAENTEKYLKLVRNSTATAAPLPTKAQFGEAD